MSLFAAAVKVVALSAALTCIGGERPLPDDAAHPPAHAAGPLRLQCRMYFGCTPTVPTRTTVAQRQQEYVR